MVISLLTYQILKWQNNNLFPFKYVCTCSIYNNVYEIFEFKQRLNYQKKKKRSKKAKNFEPKPKAASFSGYKNIWIILDQTLKVHMVGNKKKITINKIHILILR